MLKRPTMFFISLRKQELPTSLLSFKLTIYMSHSLQFIRFITLWRWYINITITILDIGVGVVLAADSQSTSKSGYRASLWDPWPDLSLLFFILFDNYVILLSMRPYPSSCLVFKTQLNSIGLSVPHRKHITSPLRAQQVNDIYRFLTTVY
jgi:hypothetical protein